MEEAQETKTTAIPVESDTPAIELEQSDDSAAPLVPQVEHTEEDVHDDMASTAPSVNYIPTEVGKNIDDVVSSTPVPNNSSVEGPYDNMVIIPNRFNMTFFSGETLEDNAITIQGSDDSIRRGVKSHLLKFRSLSDMTFLSGETIEDTPLPDQDAIEEAVVVIEVPAASEVTPVSSVGDDENVELGQETTEVGPKTQETLKYTEARPLEEEAQKSIKIQEDNEVPQVSTLVGSDTVEDVVVPTDQNKNIEQNLHPEEATSSASIHDTTPDDTPSNIIAIPTIIIEDFSEEVVFEVNEENEQYPIDQMVEQVVEETAQEVVADENEAIADQKPIDSITEQVIDETVGETAEEIGEETVEEVVEKTVEDVAEETAEEPIGAVTVELVEKLAEETVAEPVEEIAEKLSEENVEGLVEETAVELAEVIIEVPVENARKEFLEEITTDAVEASIEGTIEHPNDPSSTEASRVDEETEISTFSMDATVEHDNSTLESSISPTLDDSAEKMSSKEEVSSPVNGTLNHNDEIGSSSPQEINYKPQPQSESSSGLWSSRQVSGTSSIDWSEVIKFNKTRLAKKDSQPDNINGKKEVRLLPTEPQPINPAKENLADTFDCASHSSIDSSAEYPSVDAPSSGYGLLKALVVVGVGIFAASVLAKDLPKVIIYGFAGALAHHLVVNGLPRTH